MKTLVLFLFCLVSTITNAQYIWGYFPMTQAEWEVENMVLDPSYFAFSTDKGTYRQGDGIHVWAELETPDWRFGDWDTLGTAENVRTDMLKEVPVGTAITTNSAGVATWTFPNEFDFTPVVTAVALDNTSNTLVSVKVTALSTTSVSVQVEKISIVLGVLTLAGTPGATLVHLTAIAP